MRWRNSDALLYSKKEDYAVHEYSVFSKKILYTVYYDKTLLFTKSFPEF